MQKLLNIAVIFTIAGFCVFMTSCQNEVVDDKTKAERIVAKYGSANSELAKLYEYAVSKNDGDIMFLLANMEDKYSGKWQIDDVLQINADSLIASVVHSRKVWSALPWAGQYSEEQFRDYVLPYRMGKEPLEYYWKQDAYSKYFREFADEETIMDYVKRYNSGIGFWVDLGLENNDYSYSSISEAKTGSCANWTLLCVMALRAAGIPAAEQVIVHWGDYNNSHSLPALIFPDETSICFEGPYLAENTVDKAIPKMYRRMYSVQDETPIYKYRSEESIPKVFNRFDLKDVSDKFPMYVMDIAVDIPKELDTDSRIVYLGVFSRGKWAPVAYAEKKGRKALFPAMGTGHQLSGEFVANGYDIGEGIVYMPCFYIGDSIVPAGPVMIASKDDMKVLKPDTVNTQTVVLSRKFPCKTNTIIHFHDIVNATFEASNNVKNDKWDKLHKVYLPPRSRVNQVPVESDTKYKYARVRMPKGRLSIAELRFYDQNGDIIKGKMISDEYVPYYGDLESMTDGKPLTYITTENTFDAWLGMEFEKPEEIAMIEYWPRSDDNDVSAGDTYELFYWDGQWKSLGQKVAQQNVRSEIHRRHLALPEGSAQQAAAGENLIYENVPSNAFFWLRNLTKGKEERPFTYENQRQVWW